MSECVRSKGSPASYEEKLRMLRHRVRETEVAGVMAAIGDAGFRSVLIKGWAASLYYPNPWVRSIGDCDIAVDRIEYEPLKDFVAERGLVGVDLHCELRHLDTKPWDEIIADSRIEMCEGVPVRVPSAEDHLRILVTHWLTDGGGYRSKLLDVRYVIENRGEPFDWEKCLAPVSGTRQRWVKVTAALAVRYCGLDPALLPFYDEVRELPGWLVPALEKEWASGFRLTPLHFVLRDRRELFRQIRKRIPPNPIQATIETEGELDDGPRWPYQIKSVLLRIRPAARRVGSTLFGARRTGEG